MKVQSKRLNESIRRNISRTPWLSGIVKQFYYALPTSARSLFGIDDYRTPVELILKPLIKHKDIFFIKIGANDGLRSDPIAALIRQYKWTGIMVEPVKYLFNKLVKNHQTLDGIKCINAAIADINGTKVFYSIREKQPGEKVPGWMGSTHSILMFYLNTKILFHKLKITWYKKVFTA
ncbi:MAG: hypothetical protein WCA35_28930 [Kovacikia sp.]